MMKYEIKKFTDPSWESIPKHQNLEAYTLTISTAGFVTITKVSQY